MAIEPSGVESKFDKWKKGDVEERDAMRESAERQVLYMSEEAAIKKYSELVEQGQGVTTKPFLTEEEKALRDALAKRLKL